MSQIVKDTVSNQVHRYLRGKIIQGKYAEGARLVEEEIANELGVSRTPVREALWHLRSFDLVRPLGKSGYEVVNIRRELGDILDIRAALKSHAARKAAVEISDTEIAALEDLCKRMENLPFEDRTGRAQLNLRFHEGLIAAAGNPRLSRLVIEYQEYFDLAQPIFNKNFVQRTQRQHREIVQALKERDPDKAAQKVNEHIVDAAQFLAEILANTTISDDEGEA